MITLVVPTLAEELFLPFHPLLAHGAGLMSPIGGPIVTLMSMFNPYYTTPRHTSAVHPGVARIGVGVHLGALRVDDLPLRPLDGPDAAVGRRRSFRRITLRWSIDNAPVPAYPDQSNR